MKRLRKASLKASSSAKIARIPISNMLLGGDYTGQIFVGPKQKPMNVILDTGSSALAIDGKKYKPDIAGGDITTDLAQTDSYGDGSSWTGAVIQTTLGMGSGGESLVLKNGNAAITYQASSNMFQATDGILGLAYAALDDAYTMPKRYVVPEVYGGAGAKRQAGQYPAVPDAAFRPWRGGGHHFVSHAPFLSAHGQRRCQRPDEPRCDDRGRRRGGD
jgi:hypothetical protein